MKKKIKRKHKDVGQDVAKEKSSHLKGQHISGNRNGILGLCMKASEHQLHSQHILTTQRQLLTHR
jgi:hypothetical protein